MSDKEIIENFVQRYNALKNEMGKVIVGQDKAVDSLLLSIFTGGHCLLVGVPGLAKTLMVNTLSKALGLTFNRIQFTPDLMPSDITGSEILDENRKFQFIKGPVFANIVLADEINRPPQDPGRFGRGHAGKVCHRVGQELSTGGAVLCLGDAEPH